MYYFFIADFFSVWRYLMIVLFLFILIMIFWLLWIHCDFYEFKKNLTKKYEQLEKQINSLDSSKIGIDESAMYKEELSAEKPKETLLFEDDAAKHGNADEQSAKVQHTVNVFEKDEKSKRSIENIFFGSLFNKIGALALVIAIGIFITVVSQFIVFTPLMRIAAGFVAGLAFVFVSLNMHKKSDNMKPYAEVLLGVGLAVLFISTYCATGVFHLFSTYLGLGIGCVLLLSTYFLAGRYKSYSALGIGLFGGYLTPFFLNDNLSQNFLFCYLLFMNAIALVYVYVNSDKRWLNFVNLVLTTVLLFGTSIFAHDKFSIICPIILWVMYLSFDLLRILTNKIQHEKEHYMSSYINLGILAFLSWLVFSGERMLLGLVLFSYAFIYLAVVCYFLSRNQKKILRPYFYALIAVVYMGTFFVSAGMTRVLLWTFETLFITSLRYFLDLKYLTKWVLFFSLTCIVSILRLNTSIVPVEGYVPLLNSRLVLFGVPALVMFGCSSILAKCPKSRDSQVSLFLTFLYSTMIYLYVIFEFNAWMTHSSLVSNSVDDMFVTLKAMVNVCIGFIYALHLKFLADIKGSYIFRLLSYLMWSVSAVFLVLLGVRYVPVEEFLPILNLRFFAFAVGIACALVYSKMEKKYLFDYLAITLGFFLISYETADYLIKFGLYDSSGFIITIMWIFYLAALSLFGLAFNVKSLKNSAIYISILAIFKIIFYDIAGLASVYKVLVLLVLGAVLMLISYLYNKSQVEESRSDDE